MAKQFQVVVQEEEVSFPSAQVRIVELMSSSFIDYGGTSYNTSLTVNEIVDLANDGGTEQVLATVLRVNDGVQVRPVLMGFPASSLNVYPSTVSGSNSVINFMGSKYYASETPDALIDAANTGGGGGVTIYTGDGSLAGDRIAQMAGHDLTFIDTATHTQLAFDLGEHEATLQMSDGTASAQINLYANAIGNLGFIIESSNGVDKDVSITGITTDQSITYSAVTHLFNGNVNIGGVLNLPDQAAPASPNDGDIWREDNTNTGLKIRINGVTKTIAVV